MNRKLLHVWGRSTCLLVCLGITCPGTVGPPDTGDPGHGGNAAQTETLQAIAHVTNTGGASGIALRPSDGALFAVNSTGLFGPLDEGDDLSQMQPFGAENLATPAIFGTGSDSLVLAITESGEFWIGSSCCVRLAVVPPAGGDAQPFNGLITSSSNIKAETMTIVPDDFAGEQIQPGQLLVGQETTFSRLAAIDVEDDRAVTRVSNPLLGTTNRNAHHLAFGPGPVLYSSRGTLANTIPGLQTIATDGSPAFVAGSERYGIHSFVVRNNGDLVMRARHNLASGSELNGVLIFSPADQTMTFGLGYTTAETSENDELVISADGSDIYMALPKLNQIVRLVDAP